MKNRWTIFRLAAGLVLGIALCVVLFRHLDIAREDWLRLSQNLSIAWIAVILLLTIVLWWSAAVKWALWSNALHGEAGREPAPGFFLRHVALQSWIGQFLPPALAIVMGRSWAARHMPGVNWRAGAGNGIYDQAMEFLLLSALLPAAYLILHDHAAIHTWLPIAVIGMLVIAALIWLARGWMPAAGRPFLIPLLAWSAFRVILTVLRLAAGAPALGLAIDPASIAAAAPVVALLMVIPLTPGNLGIAEWGWVGVLAYGGTDPVDAGLLAMGYRLLIMAVQSLLLICVLLKPLLKSRST